MTSRPKSKVASVYLRLLAYVKPYWFIIVPAVVATAVYALVTGTVPFFMEDVFERLRDTAEEAVRDAESPLRLPLLILFIFGFRGVIDFLTVYGLSWVGRSAIRDMRSELFRKYLYLPARFYDQNSTGDLISKLTFNTEQIAEAISSAVVVVVRDTLLVLVMIGVMASFNLQLTLILGIVGPTIALVIGAMSRAFRRYSKRIQDSMGDATRAAEQALQGHRVVKIFAGQEHEQQRFNEINSRNFRLNLRLVGTRAFGDILTQYVVAIGVATIIFLVFSGWLTEDLDSPGFMGFITAVGILLAPLKRLINTNAVLQRGIAAADALFAVLDAPVEQDHGSISLDRARGTCEFRQVAFSYSGERQAVPVLRDVSFRVEAGSTVAFVGRSGSGKSTVVSLLSRFYDVTDGEILLDGRDISTYRMEDVRRQLSFVSQDVVLFDDTIAGNIAYGAPNCTREDIVRAADAAYVSEFAAEMPDGLDSQVGERGSLLSGGQRQRIAIARALLKDAPILILDEATSALDAESERTIQSALTLLMRGRTTLVIAHRLSTVEAADQIVVMKDGRIVECGSHAELLAQAGDYAALYRMQLAG